MWTRGRDASEWYARAVLAMTDTGSGWRGGGACTGNGSGVTNESGPEAALLYARPWQAADRCNGQIISMYQNITKDKSFFPNFCYPQDGFAVDTLVDSTPYVESSSTDSLTRDYIRYCPRHMTLDRSFQVERLSRRVTSSRQVARDDAFYRRCVTLQNVARRHRGCASEFGRVALPRRVALRQVVLRCCSVLPSNNICQYVKAKDESMTDWQNKHLKGCAV